MEVKVLVISLLCFAAAFALPLDSDASDTHLTLADIENENQAFAVAADENPQEVARSKRFLLKKLALLKAGALGVGAIGLIGGGGGALRGIQLPNPLGAIGQKFGHIFPGQPQYGVNYQYQGQPAAFAPNPPQVYAGQSYGPPPVSAYAAEASVATAAGPNPLPSTYDFRSVPVQGPGKVYVVCDQQ